MKPTIGLFATILLTMGMMPSCSPLEQATVSSPDGRYEFIFHLEEGRPFYHVYFKGQEIIGASTLGFSMADAMHILGEVAIEKITDHTVDTAWDPVYGEKSQYRDHYHQTLISFNSKNNKAPVFKLEIRAYNEGVAFRYVFEDPINDIITAELTEFTLPPATELWASTRAQSSIEKVTLTALKDTVERPLLAQLSDSLFVALGEAGSVDFARMKLALHPEKPATLVANLSSEVTYEGPFKSPWRTIMAGQTAGEILENNYLLLNLNEPNRIANTDWIKPGKVIREVTLTTTGGMACVDFAVKHQLQYIEFDAGWYGNEYDEASDATTVTVDPKRSKGPLDLPKVIAYAQSQGIGVLLYVNRRALEKQLDEVLPLLSSWGVKGVKYGFVNVGSQQWTDWLHEAVRKAAAHELMVDIHDEYRPTGYSRTYPNLMTQEGIRGDEESPDNSMVLKTMFTRMLAGAGDHTNCYFASRVDEKMGSHASQLAKAVCIYSPWQFLYWYDRPADAPSKMGGAGNNDKHIIEVPELNFYDQLPTVWDDTRVLEGYPGAYAVIARRSGTTWFVGALNGSEERDFNINLDFLPPNSQYEASIYSDDQTVSTPTKVAMKTTPVSSVEVISQRLGKYQGMAMILKEVGR
ncbi:MAG: glycoside hydrolase family 97 N-terminal domain-containing protein [Saprospiraceae bacterium]